MANFIGLDKGYVAEAAGFAATGAAVSAYRIVQKGATDQSCVLATAATQIPLGVTMEALDASKLATGKAVINLRMGGIAPITASTTVLQDALVTSDGQGRAVTATSGQKVIGKALQASGGAGEIINVLLTPGIVA